MSDITTFTILRLLTLVPSAILTIVQFRTIIKKWKIKDSMGKYRLLLFLFTLSFTIDNAIVFYSDICKLIFGISHGDTFNDLTTIRYLSRIVELIAIFYFYKLIYGVKNGKND